MKKILVFGSNLAGRHTKGVALRAYNEHGAIYGQATGLHGNSYAIPTHDEEMKPLTISKIGRYIDTFIRFAELNPDYTFEVSRIGCVYPGYEDSEIAPMFAGAPKNCILPAGWRTYAKVQTIS